MCTMVITGVTKMISQDTILAFYNTSSNGYQKLYDTNIKGLHIEGRNILALPCVRLNRNNIIMWRTKFYKLILITHPMIILIKNLKNSYCPHIPNFFTQFVFPKVGWMQLPRVTRVTKIVTGGTIA